MRLYNLHSATPVTVNQGHRSAVQQSVPPVRRNPVREIGEPIPPRAPHLCVTDSSDPAISFQTFSKQVDCHSTVTKNDDILAKWSLSTLHVTDESSSCCSSLSSKASFIDTDAEPLFPDNVLDNKWYISMDRETRQKTGRRPELLARAAEACRHDEMKAIFCLVNKKQLTPGEIAKSFGPQISNASSDTVFRNNGSVHTNGQSLAVDYGGRYVHLLGYDLQQEYQLNIN